MRRQRYKPQRSLSEEETVINRAKFFRKVKYVLTLLALVVVLLVFWQLPRKVIIKNIVCINKEGTCSERMVNVLNQNIGKNLVESKESIGTFLSTELIRESTIRYLYPATLKVTLLEAKPVFAISNNDQNDFRLVDSKGFVVGKSTTSKLPFVRKPDQLPEIGVKVSDEELFGLQLMRDLTYSYQIGSGELTSGSLTIELPTSQSVIFPLEGERDLVLGSFVLVMNQLNSVKSSSTMEKVGLENKIIDLRFKNPVIK